MDFFSRKVDLEMLDKCYLKLISSLYECKLREPVSTTHVSTKGIPKSLLNFDRYMDVLK